MNASALEREISSLEIRSDSLEAWLLLWIILIVIGLVVEVFVVVKEHVHRVENRTGWTLLLQLIGPMLITIGVAGELGIHVKAGHVNMGLRNANRKVVGLLNKEAGDARREAGTAIKAAGDANERAKKYEGDIARAREQATKAERGTAQARLELVKLKAVRTLDSDQQSRIVTKLRPFQGAPFVLAVNPNAESIEFMGIVTGVLIAAKWAWQPAPTDVDTIGGTAQGINLGPLWISRHNSQGIWVGTCQSSRCASIRSTGGRFQG